MQHVILLVHGYTNCPAQFGKLGRQFYDLGYNVLIAPLPHHGLADRLNDEQGQLSARELTAYADEMMLRINVQILRMDVHSVETVATVASELKTSYVQVPMSRSSDIASLGGAGY